MENNLTWQNLKGINARGHHSGSQRFFGGPKTNQLIDFGETIGIKKLAQITNATLRLI
jgi:hypothetical protein